MFSLIILIIIQFFFCLFFFLYFRYKITKQLKLKEFKQEIEEVTIAFNRQAEWHISYLEKLLSLDIFKDKSKVESKLNQLHNQEENIKHNQTIGATSTPPSSHTETHSSSTLFTQILDIPTPPSIAHNFYAQIKDSKHSKVLIHNKEKPLYSSPRVEEPYSPIPLESNSIGNLEKKNNFKNEIQNKILSLYEKGIDNSQIAKRLSISTAEVKLTLKLKGKI